MAEITVDIPSELDKELLSELKRDISMVVRLRIARELILKEWDRRFSKSKLTEKECSELGKQVNASAVKLWKEKGWL